MTRTMSPDGVECRPSTAKGSRLRPSATACKAVERRGSSSIDALRRGDRAIRDTRQPVERNAEPGRPVGGLVADFVRRLFHQEQVEQGGFALLANPATLARHMTGPVGGEKGVAGVVGKAVEDRWPPRPIGLRRALRAPPPPPPHA